MGRMNEISLRASETRKPELEPVSLRAEQFGATTLAELTALGVRRGYGRPEAWARKVLAARSKKQRGFS